MKFGRVDKQSWLKPKAVEFCLNPRLKSVVIAKPILIMPLTLVMSFFSVLKFN
jgi:hypothetical protein